MEHNQQREMDIQKYSKHIEKFTIESDLEIKNYAILMFENLNKLKKDGSLKAFIDNVPSLIVTTPSLESNSLNYMRDRIIQLFEEK